MKIAKPMLLVSTPIGVAGGLFEAYRLAGGLVLLMFAMMSVVGAGFAMVVATIQRESGPSGQSVTNRHRAPHRPCTPPGGSEDV
jgi:hypothetical protein